MPRIRLTILICWLLSLGLVMPVFAQDALPLTQQFTSKNQPIMFSYPADWVIDVRADSPSVMSVKIGPDQATFDKNPLTAEPATFAPGEVYVIVQGYPKEVIRHGLSRATDADVSMKDVLKYFNYYVQSKVVQFGSVSETTMSDHPAARMSFTVPEKAEGFEIAADFGDTVGAILVYNALGETANWEATSQAILASMSSIPGSEPREPVVQPAADQAVELTQNYTSKDGIGGFQFPAGWRIDDQSGGNFLINTTIATTIPALDINLSNSGDQYFPGEVSLQIRVVTADALFSSAIGLQYPTDDPLVFLQAAVQHAGSNLPYKIGEVIPTTVNGLPAARADLDAGTRAQGFVMDVHLARGILVRETVFTAAGERARWDATIQAIIASLHYGDTAESTPESTASAVTELNATFTALDGSVTYQYPAGWGATGSLTSGLGNIALANNSNVLGLPPVPRSYAPGEFLIVYNFTAENPNAQVPGLSSTTDPVDILDAYIKALTSSYGTPSSDTMIGAVTARDINGQPGAQVQINHGDLGEALFMLFRYRPGVFCLISITGAPGETAKLADTALAILATVSITESPTPEATAATG